MSSESAAVPAPESLGKPSAIEGVKNASDLSKTEHNPPAAVAVLTDQIRGRVGPPPSQHQLQQAAPELELCKV